MSGTARADPTAPHLTVLSDGVDRLLAKLRAVFGEAGRSDIAPELAAALDRRRASTRSG
jgi:hypothetical protein